MKRICLLLLLLSLLSPLLCACKQDVQVEESGGGPQTYQLPTEWTVTVDGETLHYAVSCEGGDVTLTKEGETVLRFTLDKAGNAVSREEPNGARLEAVYDAEGRLTETLLRDTKGEIRQRTVYDREGRAVQIFTRGHYGEAFVRAFTYGKEGELLTETQYDAFKSYIYEYHPNGEVSAETVLLLDALPYYRQEFDEAGRMRREYDYDEDGNVSYRYDYDEEGKCTAEYDAEGNLCMDKADEDEEKIYDENGNLTESIRYKEDGTLYERYEYDYDEKGNQVAWRHYHSDGTLSREVFLTYGESGALKKTVQRDYSLNSGALLDATEIEYDEAGNQILYSAYDAEETLSSRTEMAYAFIAGKWAMTLRTAYNGDGNLWLREELLYDEKGNNTVDVTYDAEGNPFVRVENTYDERGNQTEHVRYDENGTVFYREVSVYDAQDFLQEYTAYDADGSVGSHVLYENTYECDGAGRPVRVTRAVRNRRLTYTRENGGSLQKETVCDESGDVVRSFETVCDNNGRPRICQHTEGGRERRYEFEWTPEGGLLACVWKSADGEDYSRLETGGHVACELTEAQYRQLLELLLTETGAVFQPRTTLPD